MPSASSSTDAPYSAAAQSPPVRQVSEREAEIVTGILREFSQYQTRRAMFAMQWEEVAQLILPTSRNTFFYGNYNTPGLKKTQQQVDATGAAALHNFCAIADSLVTPRNMKWHGLTASDPYVMKDRATQEWFENTTVALFKHRYAAHAGFASQNYNNWQSLGAFGNATMFIDRFDNRWSGGGRGLRYKAVPLGETFYGQNHQGQVDRMIRWFRLTAYQAVQKWGREALPPALEVPLKANSEWRYNFLHCVKPRGDDYDSEALDHRAFKFCSYYVSIEGRCLMGDEGGYDRFPYAVSRYDQAPEEVEGRGPAQIVLPALKTLNAQKTTFLKQGHRAADPVLLMADDGLVGMDLRPGAQNKGGVNSDGKPMVHTLPTGNIDVNEKMMDMERTIIDNAFLTTIMKTLVENPNMKATQVVQIVAERGMLVAPTLGRQHTEYVGSMVPRELDLLVDMGMLDPMPPRLREAGGSYEIIDSSPLAQAARTNEAAGFNNWVENLRQLAVDTQDPSWLDVVSNERSAPELATIYNVPIRWTADANEMAAKAKARSDQAAQKAQIEALPAKAAMINAQAKSAKVNMGQQGGTM